MNLSLQSPPPPSPDWLTPRAAAFSALPQTAELEVLVPAFNEEHRLEATLRTLAGHLRGLPVSTALRVVDNGSSDRTADCVDRVAASGTPVTLTGCSLRGKGAAVARGVLTSRARWTGFCDADLATSVTALDDALCLLRNGWQVVLGSRLCAGATLYAPQPPARRLGGAGFRLLTRRLRGPVTDTQCGFKFFETAAVRPVFARLTTTGFAFDVEVVARCRARGLRMIELPVEWENRRGSSFRPVTDGRRVAVDLWRLHRLRDLAEGEPT
ncbi:glycosyltransferase [Streptomyces sp. DH12]|uniref:glycosyltransferase n=1 Tax=Streptomyces sp. DH12 TaxID=2857010 RepID=UPI001E57AFBB|nr:glycosyltransferase [Streptomyces sp. DH12]